MVTPVTIGHNQNTASATTIVLTTTAAVPAGGKVLLAIGYRTGSPVTSITNTGGAPPGGWIIEQLGAVATQFAGLGVAYADFPAGLASGSTITATYTPATVERSIQGAYALGLAPGAAYAKNHTEVVTLMPISWTTPAITVNGANDLVFIASHGSAGNVGTTTNTPGANQTELSDFDTGDGEGTVSQYWTGSAGSVTGSGTWATTGGSNAHDSSTSHILAYAAATVSGGGAPFTPMLPMMHRFMPPAVPIFGFPKLDGGAVGAALFNQPLTATAVAVTASFHDQINKLLTATSLAVTASMLRTVGKLLSSTAVAVTASMIKQVAHAMTSTAVAVTAALSTVKVKLLAMTATAVVVTATMLRQVNKILTSSSMAVTASMVRQVGKFLTATAVAVTATLATVKVKLQTMTATAVVVTASMLRQAQTHLTASSVALSATMLRSVGKTLKATNVVVTGTLATVKVRLQAMTATTISVTGTMFKRVGKTLSATSVVTAVLTAVSSAISTFFSSQFDPSVGRGISGDNPQEDDYTTDPHGNIRSNPHQGGFDS